MRTPDRAGQPGGDPLGRLAAEVRRTVGCDAVLIRGKDGDGPVIAFDGPTPEAAPQLARDAPRIGADAHACGGMAAAPLTFAGDLFGEILAVGLPAGRANVLSVLEIYGRHAALGLALRGTRWADGGDPDGDELHTVAATLGDLAELNGAVAEAAGGICAGARAALVVADRKRHTLQMVRGGFGGQFGDAITHRVSSYDAGSVSARVLATGQPFLTNDVAGDPGLREHWISVFGVERLLSIPLGDVGVLHVTGDEPFTLDDVGRGLAIAPRIRRLVGVVVLVLELRRNQRLDGILADGAMAVAGGAGVEDFLATALGELCEAIDAGLLAVVLEGGAGPILARRGRLPEEVERLVLDEAGDVPGLRAYVVGSRTDPDQPWAAFHAPVRLGPEHLGTVSAVRMRDDPFAEPERRALARMADLVALARATERYEHQRTDLARMHERQRIADDLHDDVAQILFAAQLSLDGVLQGGLVPPRTVDAITRARALIIRGDAAIRTVIHRLSGPAAADVGSRLEAVAASVEDEFPISVHVDVAPAVAGVARNLPPAVSDALVKVAREAVVNAAKHASPCEVQVALDVDPLDRLVLAVADNGRPGGAGESGYHHHGLASLRRVMLEQGGTLSITPRPAGGTRVTAVVGVHPEPGRPGGMTPPSKERAR